MQEIITKRQNIFRRCFKIFFHASLCLMLVDWACPIDFSIGSFGFFELAYTLAIVSFICCMFAEKWSFFSKLKRIMSASKWIVVSLGIYLVAGIITVFYTQSPGFSITRYIVVAQMLFFGILFLYYVMGMSGYEKINDNLMAISINISSSSVLISVIALLGYITEEYTYFYMRIATIRDYNQYSTIILAGMVCIEFVLIRSKLKNWLRLILILFSTVLLSTTVFLADSRRSSVLLCIFGGMIVVYAMLYEIYRAKTKGKKLISHIASVVVILLCVGVSIATSTTMHAYVGTVGEERLSAALENYSSLYAAQNDPDGSGEILSDGAQHELAETFQGIFNGSGFSSRKAIWKSAFNKIKTSDATHLIFGNGASFSWDFYNDWDNPEIAEVAERYKSRFYGKKYWMNPHNLFLQDMLDGGFVLVACLCFFIGSVIVSLFKLLKKNFGNAFQLIMLFSIVFVTLFLSIAMGVICHKLLWLFTFMLIAENYKVKRMNDNEQVSEK